MSRRRWDEKERTLSVTAGHPVRLVVVADSHSRPHPRAHEWIRREEPDYILHAGDIGNLAVVGELEDIAETFAVRGNIDAHDDRTPDAWVLDLDAGDRGSLRILLTHIAVNGPRLRKEARDLAARHGARMVVCGHSHVPLVAEDAGAVVFNPGSFGPRRFHLPITFGVMELGGGPLRLRHVDCETGARWLPPGP